MYLLQITINQFCYTSMSKSEIIEIFVLLKYFAQTSLISNWHNNNALNLGFNGNIKSIIKISRHLFLQYMEIN